MSRPVVPPHHRRVALFRRAMPTHRSRRRRLQIPLSFIMGGAFLCTLILLQGRPGGQVADASSFVPMQFASASKIDAPFGDQNGAAERDTLNASFSFCGGGRRINCVVDGDTFWFDGTKIRIMDIDTPETHPARCAEEQALGDAATARLQDWLNAGAFSLESEGRETDRYGRQLRIVTRGGQSVGDVLVGEGLARPWEGRRRPWC